MIKRFSSPNNKYWGVSSERALTAYWQRRRKQQNLRQELGHNDLMSCGSSAGSACFFPLFTCSLSFFSVGQSTSALFIAFSKVTRVKITVIVMSRLDSEIKHSERTGLTGEA